MQKLKKNSGILRQFFSKDDKVGFVAFFIVAGFFLLFFVHADIMETSNHAYILLESSFSKQFFNFYDVVKAHENAYYYINNAHYNIFMYLVLAIWQLPIFIINSIFHLPLHEGSLWIWSKVPFALLFVGCGVLVFKLALMLGVDEQRARIAGLAFLLNPLAFFPPVVMGQYDTLCIFLILLSLVYYFKNDLVRFSAIISLALLCKLFAIFIFIPLLLLKEKRILRIGLFLALGAAPTMLTSLMFPGSGDNPLIPEIQRRILEVQIGSISLFPLLIALLCIYCWLRKSTENDHRDAVYIGLAVYSVLFLLVTWHPQWLIFIVPFWALAFSLQKNGLFYIYLSLLAGCGYILSCFMHYPAHIELNMLSWGLLYDILPQRIDFKMYSVSHYISMYQFISNLLLQIVPISLVSILLFQLPFKKGLSLAESSPHARDPKNLVRSLWLNFILVIGMWGGLIAAAYYFSNRA